MVWISEIMLQQTQVVTVINYFNRWLQYYPNLKTLSAANENNLLKLWSGLGYYSRVKNIHKTSKILVEQHQSQFPSSRLELLKLPGIGEYTAGAILSFGFNLCEPILDGNLIRVFSRLYAMDFYPENQDQKQKYWEHSLRWIQNIRDPAIINESLMELGATVCLRQNPLCTQCPLQINCLAFKNNKTHTLPPTKKRKQVVLKKGKALVCIENNKVLLFKSPQQQFLKGQFSFPIIFENEPINKFIHVKTLQHAKGKTIGTITHSITHHKIYLEVVLIKKQYLIAMDNKKWTKIEEGLEELTNSLSRKILKKVL